MTSLDNCRVVSFPLGTSVLAEDQGSVELLHPLKMICTMNIVQLLVAECHTLNSSGVCKEELGMVHY